MNRLIFPPVFLAVLLVTACTGVAERVEKAERIAAAHGFHKTIVETHQFRLLAYHRLEQKGAPATLFIEGDGYAFAGRRRVSTNPTPKNPVALRLARQDDSPNVVYLARPCQYVSLKNAPNCRPDYWTIRRYGHEVIEAMDEAITLLKQNEGFGRIRLVGYSGGGTVAAILAASRQDVMDLRTVAGNLDVDAFVRHHGVTPLTGSLNPTDYAGKLISIPQVHFAGKQDRIITPQITEGYLNALRKYDPGLECVRVERVSGVSHQQGWEQLWQRYQVLEGRECR